VQTEKPKRPRARRTVRLDAATFAQLMNRAAERAAGDLRAGATGQRSTAGASLAVARELQLGLMQAFIDAAQPAGGIPLADDGRPARLEALLRAGQENAESGRTQPKVLAKIRAGKGLDLRIAQGVLLFLQHALARPALTLEQMGAVEPERLRALDRVRSALRAARHELPASIADGLWRRAEETAGYGWIHDDVRIEYCNMRHFVAPCGAHRIALLRRQRIRPVRLASHPGRFQPMLAFEWHEWARIGSVRLRVRVLDRHDAVQREALFQTAKRVDAARGFVLVEPVPETSPELPAMLDAARPGGAGPRLEVVWEIEKIMNAADRDIVVSWWPMNRLHIVFEEAAHPGFVVSVGDAPGLARCTDGWRLDRTLMPREVLAVRMRLAAIDLNHVEGLSPGGEWRGTLATDGRPDAPLPSRPSSAALPRRVP
jgi:hypothetical protein